MPRPELAAAAVVVDDDRLLLVRRGHGRAAGTWSVPGGRVEEGETLAEAVCRELREETGLDGVCGPLMGWIELVAEGDDPHVVVLDFEVTLLEASDPVPGSDVADARWVDLVDVAEHHLSPGLAEFLHDHGVIATIT